MFLPEVDKFPKEIYVCGSCKKKLEIKEIDANWECLECHNPIGILADSKDTGKVRLYRKSAKNIQEGDYIYLPKSLEHGSNKVFKVIDKGDKVTLHVKNYGSATYDKSLILNLQDGSWDQATLSRYS